MSKQHLDIDGVANGGSICAYRRPEPEREQRFPNPVVVTTIGRRRKAQQRRLAGGIDVEPGSELESPYAGRRWKRRKDNLFESWRIILGGSAPGARPNATALAWAFTGPNA